MSNIKYAVITTTGEEVFGFHNHIDFHEEANEITLTTVYPKISCNGTSFVINSLGLVSNCPTDIMQYIHII